MLKIIISYQLIGLLFSCSHLKKESPYATVPENKSPDQTINTFAFETNKIKIKNIIIEDVQAEEAPSPNPNYEKKISRNFLKPVMNRDVKKWIKFFTKKDRARFLRFIKNGQKYRVTIESLLRHYGLPEELFFVGFIESGYYLGARSGAKAVGPWQFIYSTAKRYGLRINRYQDERRNLLKSTVAAAKYFKDLYNIFGSWELALSAYNAGEYGVIRRIRKANTRDYYSLSRKKVLPPETRNYIPKVLAVLHIYQNPKHYNLNIPRVTQDYFSNVDVKKVYGRTTLKQLSRKYGWNYKRIKILNAQYKRNIIPYSSSGHEIIFETKNSQTSSRELNKIAQSKPTSYTKRNKRSSRSKTYRVRKGDNLNRIAQKHNMSLQRLKKLNNLKRSRILPGQRLKVYGQNKKYYVVKPGDNLTNIARGHKLKIQDLKRHNNLKGEKIFPGQKLVLLGN